MIIIICWALKIKKRCLLCLKNILQNSVFCCVFVMVFALLRFASSLCHCHSIFVGQNLELLESLRYPLVHFQVFFHTIQRTLILCTICYRVIINMMKNKFTGMIQNHGITMSILYCFLPHFSECLWM